jgi:leader peptidase (prepilin peptidase)/N-methyltransferase
VIPLAGVAGLVLGALVGAAIPSRRAWLQSCVCGLALGAATAGLQLLGIEPTWLYAFVFPMWMGIVLIDYRQRRIPDALSWGSAAVALVGLGVTAGLTGAWSDFVRAVAVAAGCGAVTATAALVTPLGWGDVKLSLSLGLLLGWQGWMASLWGLSGAVFVAGLWAAVLMLSGRRGDSHFALAPPWILGAVAGLLASALLTS